jgi:DNA-binding NarL/FixJ family response regulator
MSSSSVAVVDDDSVICAVMSSRLSEEPELTLAGAATRPDAALELVAQTRPDVILLDGVYFCPWDVSDTMDFGKSLLEASPGSRLLLWTVWSGNDADLVTKLALSHQIGAEDFFSKNDVDTAVVAIKTAVARDGGFPPVFGKLTDLLGRGIREQAPSESDGLTNKESYWASTAPPLLAAGASWREVATRHFVAEATVHTHRQNIYRKWGIHSQPEFIEQARSRGYYR